MSKFLATSELTETKAFVHSFVKEIQVNPGRASIIYSMPTPEDSPLGGADSVEIALNGGVRKSVRHSGRPLTKCSSYTAMRSKAGGISWRKVGIRITSCAQRTLGMRP